MANEPALLTQWRERLKRQSESNMTVEAFCRQEGVSTSMFYRWQRQLQNPSSEPTTARKPATTKSARKRRGKPSPEHRSEPRAGGKSDAEPRPEFLRLPVRSVRSMPWIELMLIDGTVIRLPQENLAALTTVLQALQGRNSDDMSTEARHA